ncbi:SDR family oxidoreductase [Allomuricauda sp. d1]|uniref:SDR family oxidoreductase n=1 Tax=Allomuricauda sp. d1 TaxID=3136725 RepID=UPI0031D01780
MKYVDGKTIWITGASSGIGRELALQLNKKGCKLILSARNEKALQKVRNECGSTNTIAILPLDLEDFGSTQQKVSEALSFFGTIDILINNAGISQRSLIIDTDFEVYRKLVDVNYLGTVALSKAMLPHFVASKKGHFVVVSSLMGKFGALPRSGYCGSKHALHGFFDVLRMEHEKDNVSVTMICPGFVQTDIAKNALTKDGTPQGTDDVENNNGLPVAVFAKKMINAIEKQKFEAYMGGKEVMGVYVKRFFPKLLHRMVIKSQTDKIKRS